jgi:hypothetical protein
MKTFRIAAPFVSREEIEPLKKAGADELYCGYVDEESEKLWPIFFQTINRRLKGASFEGFSVFKEAIKEAERLRLPVYVTMNWHYTPEQYHWLIKTIKKISRLGGVKGLIVTDIGLLLTLRKMKYEKEIHISTGGTIFNYHAIDFFSSLGANRVILDRQLTAKEIVDLLLNRKSSIGIEIFAFHTACLFIDGYCTFFHCGGSLRNSELTKDIFLVKSENTTLAQGCSEIKNLLANKRFNLHRVSGREELMDNFKFRSQKYPFGCNLCSLYELRDFPQITLKVIERGANQENTVKIISELIDCLAHRDISRSQYHKKAKESFLKITNKSCNRFSCYCPQRLINATC